MKKFFSLIATMLMLLCFVIPANADYVYDYPKRDLWYAESEGIKGLEKGWSTPYELYEAALVAQVPVKGFSLDDFINTVSAQLLMDQLYPWVAFDSELDEALLTYWLDLGIEKSVEHIDDLESKYATYVPAELEEGKLYPLMIISSGGSDPIWATEVYGIAQLSAKEGYITVAPQTRDADKQIEIIKEVAAKYPVDMTRIYLTGNGGGMMSSVNTLVRYPEYFAAAVPFGCEFVLRNFRTGEAYLSEEEMEANFLGRNMQLPVMILDGTAAYTDWKPINASGNENTLNDFNMWFRINGIIAPEVTNKSCILQITYSDKKVNHYSGFDFEKTWDVTYETEYYFGEYCDANGVPLFRVGISKDGSHWHMPSYAALIWDYCSMFSRNADGSLSYTPAN